MYQQPSTGRLVLLLLTFLSINAMLVTGDRFYIVTSSDQSCPGQFTGELCITIRQYISGSYITDPSAPQPTHITLVLLRGVHQWPQQPGISLSNIISFEMTGELGSSIECPELSYGFLQLTDVENVHISGLNVSKCFTAIFDRITMLSISSSEFRSSHQRMQLSNIANGTLINSSFSDRYGGLSVVSSSILVRQSTFSNNRLDRFHSGFICRGVAIRSTSSNITVEQCTFTNNRAMCSDGYPGQGWGGAISINTGHAVISDSVFHRNTVTREGGAIYVDRGSIEVYNSTFSFNSATQVTDGGAMFVTGVNSSVILKDSTFLNNTAESEGGTLYLIGNNSRVLIHSSNFYNNTCRYSRGGAINIKGNSTVITMVQSNFINNSAGLVDSTGGALYTDGHNITISLKGSSFSNNSAAGCAVMHIEDYSHQINISDCTFTYNAVSEQSVRKSNGGVGCITSASVHISDSTFAHNSARANGGVFSVDDSTMLIQDSVFESNTAQQDGGVIYSIFSPIHPTILGSLFTHNQAENGGVLFVGRAGSHVIIKESIFSFNRAQQRGGIIHILGSELYINESNINDNTALLGAVISACSSDINVPDGLTMTVDSTNSVCGLYDGNVCDLCQAPTPDSSTIPLTTETMTATTLSPSTEPMTTTSVIVPTDASTTDVNDTTISISSMSTSVISTGRPTSSDPTEVVSTIPTSVPPSSSLSTDVPTSSTTSSDDPRTTLFTTQFEDFTTTPSEPITDHSGTTGMSVPVSRNTDHNTDGHTATISMLTDTVVKASQDSSDHRAITIAYAALGVAVVIGLLVVVLCVIMVCVVVYLCCVLTPSCKGFKSRSVENVPYDSIPLAENEYASESITEEK